MNDLTFSKSRTICAMYFVHHICGNLGNGKKYEYEYHNISFAYNHLTYFGNEWI
jgi:hypothetical protein